MGRIITDTARVLRLTAGLARRLPWCRNNPKLLHHAQCVQIEPRFLNFALRDAMDIDRRHLDWLASRRNASKLSLVRAGCGPAGRHLVSFSYLIVNRDVEVRERRADERDELFEPSTPAASPDRALWLI